MTRHHTVAQAASERFPGVPGSSRADVLTTEDGVELVLTRFRPQERVRGARGRCVLLLHGLTSCTRMYTMPEHRNLVQHLHGAGYGDVWSLDWRASGRLPHVRAGHGWSFDDAALFDIPAALQHIGRAVPGVEIHVVAHCLGAVAACMCASAGLAQGVGSLTCSAASFSTSLPLGGLAKLFPLGAVLEKVLDLDYIPIDLDEVGLFSKAGLVQMVASATRTSCRSPACQMLSFIYGTGGGCIFEHSNIDPRSHGRLEELFGPLPLEYNLHLREMSLAKAPVRASTHDHLSDRLPTNYLQAAGNIDFPIMLVSGTKNCVWGDANDRAYASLEAMHPRVDVRLEHIRGYGHQDLFIGRRAAMDVFPVLTAFLDEVSLHDGQAAVG